MSFNSWLDDAPVHKNVKSVKPTKTAKPTVKSTKKRKGKGNKKSKNISKKVTISKESVQKLSKFDITIISDALETPLPPLPEEWIINTYGESWYNEFLNTIDDLRNELLDSNNIDDRLMKVLMVCFLLQQSPENTMVTHYTL